MLVPCEASMYGGARLVVSLVLLSISNLSVNSVLMSLSFHANAMFLPGNKSVLCSPSLHFSDAAAYKFYQIQYSNTNTHPPMLLFRALSIEKYASQHRTCVILNIESGYKYEHQNLYTAHRPTMSIEYLNCSCR